MAEPPPSQIEPSVLDEQWETGQSHSAMSFEPPFCPPQRRCPELSLWQDEKLAAINKALQEPLQRSWDLAHKEKRNQISHDYFPHDLDRHLEESLEEVYAERGAAGNELCERYKEEEGSIT